MPDPASDLTKNMRVIKAMFGVFTVAMVVLLVGLYVDSRQRVNDLGDIIDRQAKDRLQAQVSACGRYNYDTATSVNKIVTELVEFVGFLGVDQTPETPRTAEEQAHVDGLVKARQAEFLTAQLPFRDCTRKGIEAYSEGTGGFLPAGTEP